MNRVVLVAILLITVASFSIQVMSAEIPEYSELQGNLVANPSFEQDLEGWLVYEYTPVIAKDIVYHGSNSLYFDWIPSSHVTMVYQYIDDVDNFIMIFHVYPLSDNYQYNEYWNDYVAIDSIGDVLEGRISVEIDYYNDQLVFVSKVNDYKYTYRLNLPVNRWVKITIIKVDGKAMFYIDDQYITSLPALNDCFNRVMIYHNGYHSPWYFDAVYVGRIPKLYVVANGGMGQHYEDTSNNILKAEVYVIEDSGSAITYIRYKTDITIAGNYVFYIPIEYHINYGIEWGGEVYALLKIKVYNSNGIVIDYYEKYLVYESGDISDVVTINGLEKYNKLLYLEPGTYYVEVRIVLYAEGWEGEAYIDMYGSNYYADLYVLGYEV
ncbi:hypothetical protein J4526_01425 [Desulfurococcaceae archaeon MEX13E-LK6-19]|nr:hypothetical protein J4526_01425 [Desulfurococcaceae archaeon MEX13E-LK6-19]